MKNYLSVAAAALWAGSMTVLGFLVVPLLFKFLPSMAIAGNMAAKLFTAQTWLSVVCAIILFLIHRPPRPSFDEEPATRATPNMGLVAMIVAGMLLALLSEFAVSPRILARENLKLWHAVGSAFYLVQWLLACAVLFKTVGRKPVKA